MKRFSVLLGSVLLMTACNRAAVPNGALVQGFQNIIRDRAGVEVGSVDSLRADAKGLRLTIWVHDLPPGVHGMHLHEGGLCDPPAFAGAGRTGTRWPQAWTSEPGGASRRRPGQSHREGRRQRQRRSPDREGDDGSNARRTGNRHSCQA